MLLQVIWLVPLLAVAVAGRISWLANIEDARARAGLVAEMAATQIEHALQTQGLALDWVLDRTRGLSWDDLEKSRVVHDMLSDLDHRYDASSEIFMVDGAGRLRGDSLAFPLGDQARSIRIAAGGASASGYPLSFGPVGSGPLSDERSFMIMKPVDDRDKEGGGFAGISVRVKFIEDILRHDALGNHAYVEARMDGGELIAAWRSPDVRVVVAPDILDDEAAKRGDAIVSSRRLSSRPFVVRAMLDVGVVQRAWLFEFLTYGAVALTSCLALAIAAWLALRSARQETLALAGWKDELDRRLALEIGASKLRKFEALGELSGGIAHYFNNLLPALRGHLEIARLEASSGRIDAERLRNLTVAVDDAREFLRGVMTWSGRAVSTFERVDFSAIVERTTTTLSPGAASRIVVVKAIEPRIFLEGQAGQLGDLVGNLLKNALESLGPEGGEIGLTLSRRVSDDGAEHIVFACRDTGCGMTAETIERAFDPFFTTRPHLGTGLGLAICDGVARGHGGAIEIQSKPGSGAIVTVTLPARQEA